MGSPKGSTFLRFRVWLKMSILGALIVAAAVAANAKTTRTMARTIILLKASPPICFQTCENFISFSYRIKAFSFLKEVQLELDAGDSANNERFEFSQVLHECILDGLRRILGESGLQAVRPDIESCRYEEDVGELHEDLYAIFGSGAFVLERAIVKELFQRLNMPYQEASDFDFANCINQARQLLKTGC